MDKQEIDKWKLKWKLKTNLSYPKCFTCKYMSNITDENFEFDIGCEYSGRWCKDGSDWFANEEYYGFMCVYGHPIPCAEVNLIKYDIIKV